MNFLTKKKKMIRFENNNKNLPYVKFRNLYSEAEKKNQKLTYAASISSFSDENKEVDSRFVNIKILDNNDFIFFTNYNSPKAKQFLSHPQVSMLFFWSSINVQVRIKAKVSKTDTNFNNEYFKNREKEKNALAISSRQSNVISSYENVQKNYELALKNTDTSSCPDYWGGFKLTSYYFEFWKGHKSRINKREVFDKIDGVWKQSFLQP